MTPRLTRRGAIELLAAGAIGSLATPISIARAAEAAAPPDTPMLFTDRVRRDLIGDAALITERLYELKFVPLAQGYRVEGTQISSTIDAPPELAPLAEVWRKTPQSRYFPFEIDRNGLVVPASGPAPGGALDLSEAIDTGLNLLRAGGSSEAELADAQAFFLWLQQAANQIGSDVPRDLFVPPPEMQQASRVIELPGGTSGTIEVSFLGSLCPETGLMRDAQRQIVTRVEGTSQRTVDSWALALA